MTLPPASNAPKPRVMTSGKRASVTAPAPKAPAQRPPGPQLSTWGIFKRFFAVDPVRLDMVADEAAEAARFHRMLRRVLVNAFIILALGVALIIGIPFFSPVYRYYALNPAHQVMPMVALNMPNMTNNAILSWATTTTTEIMTMGFGDYEKHLQNQRYRFTPDGWTSFAEAFDKQKIGELFRQRQLVLTTVPSNTPVIVAQGVNEKQIYQWKVQLPVIMTYATNNDVTRGQKALIELTIVRAPSDTYPAGIAIKNWTKGY